jgi:hypothetical protein
MGYSSVNLSLTYLRGYAINFVNLNKFNV